MASEFTVTLTAADQPERVVEWQTVYGTLTVPVKSPFPVTVEVPEKGKQPAYLLDLAALTDEQRTALILHVAGKFAAPPEEVAEYLAAAGVLPLLATGLTVTILHPQKWI